MSNLVSAEEFQNYFDLNRTDFFKSKAQPQEKNLIINLDDLNKSHKPTYSAIVGCFNHQYNRNFCGHYLSALLDEENPTELTKTIIATIHKKGCYTDNEMCQPARDLFKRLLNIKAFIVRIFKGQVRYHYQNGKLFYNHGDKEYRAYTNLKEINENPRN